MTGIAADGVVNASPRGSVRAMAALLLAASFPLWIFVALIVFAHLGRPLFFRQVRCGQGGRAFTICKFRTMHDGRDARGALLPDAMRETPVTRLLRALRLDELPQLLSILRGDMAFVGPRPLLPETIAGFGELGRRRCQVAPGLTGWSQVNGNTRLTDRQKLALDLWYIAHRSLWLDARILWMTAAVLVKGERLVDTNIARASAAMDSGVDAAMRGTGL